MKRLLISALMIVLGTVAFAQDDEVDTLFYVRPAFDKGYVFLEDGGIQQGVINICNIDQTVRFIDPMGDTLVMEGSEKALKVSIGQTTYYRFKDRFTEMVDYAGDVALGLQRQAVQIDNAKVGGFENASATASVESYGVDAMTGLYYKHIDFLPENWSFSNRFVLYKDEKFYLANKKNFLKCFPDKKDIIEAFTGKDKNALGTPEKVRELFDKLK